MTNSILNVFLKNRIFGLDVMRFFAILFVMISHSVLLINPSLPHRDTFSVFGFLGVEIFFVLSGFLIGTILIKEYEQHQTLNFTILYNFWIRRWFRTLPNYFLILTVCFIYYKLFEPNYNFTWKFLSYFVFLQNFITKHPPFFSVAWSLCVEEWFYLSFPIGLLFIEKIFRNRKSIKFKVLTCIVIYIIFPLILRLIVHSNITPNSDWDFGYRKITPLRLDAIVIGVLVAFLNFYNKKLIAKHLYKTTYAGILLSALCITIYPYREYNNVEWFFRSLYFTLTSMSLAMLLPIANRIKTSNFSYIVKPITLISITSYSIYLIHTLLIKSLLKISIPIPTYIVYILFWLLTLRVSFLLYSFFEKPCTKLRERFK